MLCIILTKFQIYCADNFSVSKQNLLSRGINDPSTSCEVLFLPDNHFLFSPIHILHFYTHSCCLDYDLFIYSYALSVAYSLYQKRLPLTIAAASSTLRTGLLFPT